MNETTREEIYQLLLTSFDLDEGDEQISMVENAVRLADLEGDLKTQYLAREQLVRACLFGGSSEKALVAFSWCLAQFDNNPGLFDQWAILWKYKWIVGIVCDFPEIPKTRIYEMLEDLSERSLKAGYGLRAVYNHRYRSEKFWDDKEIAKEYFRKMEQQPKDKLSNCSACELDDRVGFSLYCEDWERALGLAAPLLDGREKCTTVPHRTYARILLPLLRLGRLSQALQYHQIGYELVANNNSFLDKVADHLIFLALTENFERAVEIFEKHYPSMEKTRDSFFRFRFALASWLLFEMIGEHRDESIADGREPLLDLSLPRSSRLYSEGGRYDAAALAAWFKQKAEEIAERFDERNGTEFFARTLAETSSLKRLSTPCPLAAPEAGAD